MLKRLFGCVREFKKPTILTLIFIIGESIIETLIPFVTADLVNKIKASAALSDGSGMKQVISTGILLAIMAFVSLACGAIAARCCAVASSGFAKNLRHDLYDRINAFSFKNVDKFSSTSLVTRMTTDVQNVQMSYMMIIRTAIRSPLMLIFSVIMSFVMGGALAMTFVVIIPVLGVGLWLVGKKALPAFRSVFRKYDRLNESIEENVRGMRVVKGFSREGYEKEKFGAAADNIRGDFTRAERIVAWNRPIMQICLYFNMIFVLLVGSRLAISAESNVDVGQLSAMLTYGVQVLMSLMMLSMIYVIITMSTESMKRIDEVLCEAPSIRNPENPVMAVNDGSIDFDNVNFKYSAKAKRYALSDIDLHIKSGMTVGVIGGTGSGKTSLVQLIPRLYDVTEGAVRVGGIDVRSYDIEALRDAVAMVLQKNLLFSGTIKENLRWGNENATDEEIIEACKLAQADEFVQSFPEKYDTYIEQGGTNVSGGQKQRLCIARALLKKPKILILDDSTSAVDTKTDALIRQGFATYIPETTKIIIAQRVASVENADLILVMENGTVVAAGKHGELLSSCEIYREIHDQQTKGGDDNA
ncbi:MAG: ABC transporter ATP-binding protein [Clostridia bacterium]|nr:ABC transporter ATP-binding protein [Clostridia bacterium]